MSKVIYRLTESELRKIIDESARRIIKEQDNSFMLQVVAQTIIQRGNLTAYLGENDAEFNIQGGKYVYITFEVDGNPYMKQGMRSSSYDVPDDHDEIIDTPTVIVNSIEISDDEGHGVQIRDNGIVKKALEKVIEVDYNGMDIPSQDDYYYSED